MIKEAHKRLEHEKTIYSKQTTDKMTSKFIDFMQDIKKVPEEYIDKGTKKQLVKARETQIFRTVQANIVNKTNQDWRLGALLKMVKDDKKLIVL